MWYLEQSHVSVETEAPWGSSPVPVCLLARCAASVLNSLIVNISPVGVNISTADVNISTTGVNILTTGANISTAVVNTSNASVNYSTAVVNTSTVGVNISTAIVNIVSICGRIVDISSTAWLLQLPVQAGVDQVGVVLIVEVELQHVHCNSHVDV